MILSKISQMFWCGVSALAVCVPAVRAQENTGMAESVPVAHSVSAKRTGKTTYQIPVLSVGEKGGMFSRLRFRFVRDGSEPLQVYMGESESGGSGNEIRASVWSAAVVAGLMRSDLMDGIEISIGFRGAVDGPSAGGIFCLAILSALDGRELPQDFAMTGTILPDGTIGLVGGVKEKIEAAAKAGIKRICVPAMGRVVEADDSLIDLSAVAEKNGVELIFVESIEEAYAFAHNLPSPEQKIISDRMVLRSSPELEDVWYDKTFDAYNRGAAITRRYDLETALENVFFSRYINDRVRAKKLLKTGNFQRASENAFESLLFMRAWDESAAEKSRFFRNYPDGFKILNDMFQNQDVPATEKDKKFLKNFRAAIEQSLHNVPEVPAPPKGDTVPWRTEGSGFYRDAPWVTEITAQLEPVLAGMGGIAWSDVCSAEHKEDLSEIKTKGEIAQQIKLYSFRDIFLRMCIARQNEGSYFLSEAERIPQIHGNANLIPATTFYHAVNSAIRQNLLSGSGENLSLTDWQLVRFFRGCEALSDSFSGDESDRRYDAFARVIADCRLFALGSALQIQYGPDIGEVTSDVWYNNYENTHFLDSLIRSARAKALSNIKKCRDSNIPCLAALSAFTEADTSRGDRERDQLFDVLANYWTASNIAQALTLCFDPQPTLEESAQRGNADAQFLLGHRAGLSGDMGKARELLTKSAKQGDARAQYQLSTILTNDGDRKTALSWLEKSAKQNYAPALERLAWIYWNGEDGVTAQDRKKAFSLFKTAAYLGASDAQERLAWCYINEENIVKEDVPRGLVWQLLAAERDNCSAQCRLAYDYKRMTKENPDRWFDAFRWFSRAAEQGHARAAADLGDCYWFGHGVEKDQKLAAEWFKKSAEGGNEYGQYNYGFCLYNGGGVETNREEGLMWLRRAAENGSENAKKYLEELNGDETGGGSEASSPSASTTEDDCLLTVSLGDNVSMTFVTISEGKFTMGSPKSEDGRYTDENQVSVELNPFWIGQTEVTQAQWKSVMGNNPSYFKGDSLPVECVSWDEAMEFCRKLTERERKKGLPEDYKFTLPTEAQWEYACRAGTTTRFSFGNSDRNLYLYGNFYDRSGDTKYDAAFREKNGWKIPPDPSQDDGFVETAPVGSFRPNAWGLYDMHGNVWEWCLDYYNPSLAGGENPYKTTPGSGDYGSCRVNRGGGWNFRAQCCRSAYRNYYSPGNRYSFLGFRVALVRE